MDDEREEDGEPMTAAEVLKHCSLLSDESDQPVIEYPVGVSEVITPTGQSIRVAIICIGEVDGSFLVAVPYGAWRRTVARRRLPSSFLAKPLACDVLLAAARDPAAETTSGKVWIGWLSADFWETISFDTGGEPALTIPFDDDELFLPLASGLVEAAQNFLPSRLQPSSYESLPPEPDPALASRVTALEASLAGISQQLETLVTLQTKHSPAVVPPRAPVKPAGARPKASRAASAGYAGLDPAVVQSALAAGIQPEQLAEMSKVAMAGKPRLPDLPKAAPAKKDPLSESEEEVIGLDVGERPGKGSYGGCIDKADCHRPTPGTSEKEGQFPGGASIDGSGLPGSSESGSMPSSRKNAAALQALRKALHSDPEKISRVIENNMETDFQLHRTGLPGSSPVQVSARAWLEARSRVQNFKTPVTLLWGIAGILDALRENRPEEARARACLLLCQGDQLSIDKGSWIVAAPMSLEDPPPYAVLATHTLPTESESQVTKLVDARWVDLFLHHLHEIDQLTEKKKKLAFRKPAADPPTEHVGSPKRGLKGKGSGKGSGSGGAGKEAGKEASKEKEAA